jgi:hypothetical protein
MHRFDFFAHGWAARALTVLLACGLALTATSALATLPDTDMEWQADDRYWNFRVLLDDREIGFHEFRVLNDGTEQRVEIDAQFDVKVLFITAYSYRHSNVENWRNGCLVSIRSSTDDNGDRLEVAGRTGEEGFVLERSGEPRELTGNCIRSFAYWNPGILTAGKLLNAQTGELVDVAIEERGAANVPVGDRSLPARHYRITMDDGTIDLWYHRDSGQWLALEAPTEGGRVLRYEPVGLPLEPVDGDRLVMD